MVLWGFSRNIIGILSISFCFGALTSLVMASSQTIWQSYVPVQIQGKVFAARRMTSFGLTPVAILASIPLALIVFEPILAYSEWSRAVWGPGMVGKAVQKIVPRVVAGVGPCFGQWAKNVIIGYWKRREAEQCLDTECNGDDPECHPVSRWISHHLVFQIPPRSCSHVQARKLQQISARARQPGYLASCEAGNRKLGFPLQFRRWPTPDLARNQESRLYMRRSLKFDCDARGHFGAVHWRSPGARVGEGSGRIQPISRLVRRCAAEARPLPMS